MMKVILGGQGRTWSVRRLSVYIPSVRSVIFGRRHDSMWHSSKLAHFGIFAVISLIILE